MLSALRKHRRLARVALLAVTVSVVARPVSAQERQDSVVESSRTALRLGDKTIRVLLGRTAAPGATAREASFGNATWNGRRFRGTIDFVSDGDGVAVVNRVDLEDYLRGVLPGEIGSRDSRDRAALQAQAVAARTYAAARMGERRTAYDVTSTVSDQVYGGVGVERPETDDAVRATRGLVLTWGDRIVSAPYHSHGGLMTASPEEVFWRSSGEPWLRPVDDHSPDGGCYCDASLMRAWERRFTTDELRGLLTQYGRDAGMTLGGDVRGLRIVSRGPSGRVTVLEVETSVGRASIRGNDIRFVLRTDGAILPSTSFALEMIGGVAVVRGMGNGHGVGMSQWGAIGRARAGQDARAILAAYYPGTRLSPLQ